MRDPKNTVSFKTSSDNIDRFLQQLERELAYAPQQFWGAYLVRSLQGPALIDFNQKFEDLNDIDWTLACNYLRNKYRSPSHIFDVCTRALKANQKSSTAAYLQFVEEQLTSVECSPAKATGNLCTFVIAAVALGLKPAVLAELRKDPKKFTSTYSYSQFKDDAVAVDKATSNVGTHNSTGRNRVMMTTATEEDEYAETTKSQDHDHDQATANNSNSNSFEQDSNRQDFQRFAEFQVFMSQQSRKNSQQEARRPAFKFPEDYKFDTSCRYCRDSRHLAPCCPRLYAKLNDGVEIQGHLVDTNNKILGTR